MSSNKVEGLCAPTVLTVQRKVKGYIFQRHNGEYYSYTYDRKLATVYSMEDIKRKVAVFTYWGRKGAGKWIVVYE